jgi:DNA-directed RNA polymerase subunit RPC12/RpoP
MAKHVESYLCIVCNAIVLPLYRWAGQQVACSCPQCGRRFKLLRPTPALVAVVGPRPARAETPGMFMEGGS